MADKSEIVRSRSPPRSPSRRRASRRSAAGAYGSPGDRDRSWRPWCTTASAASGNQRSDAPAHDCQPRGRRRPAAALAGRCAFLSTRNACATRGAVRVGRPLRTGRNAPPGSRANGRLPASSPSPRRSCGTRPPRSARAPARPRGSAAAAPCRAAVAADRCPRLARRIDKGDGLWQRPQQVGVVLIAQPEGDAVCHVPSGRVGGGGAAAAAPARTSLPPAAPPRGRCSAAA